MAIITRNVAMITGTSGADQYVDLPLTSAEQVDGLADVAVSGSYNDLTDTPTTLPANGGNSTTVNNHTVNIDVPSDAKFTDTTYEEMQAASTTAAGSTGLVPAPTAGENNRYLRSDGTWAVPPDNDTVYTHPDTHSVDMITGLSSVATSGSYDDLTGKPDITSLTLDEIEKCFTDADVL